MPEGPELFLAARYVNQMCANRVFSGKVVKSAVSLKNPDIPWDEACYKISATSRGKEVKLTLCQVESDSKNGKGKPKGAKSKLNNFMEILFRFGMSGQFKFQPHEDYQNEKHAHLNFFSTDDMVLSFVDYRRFGRWEVTSDWGPNRGPCVIQEPEMFRKHVLNSLAVAAFKKPICEVLLDQKHFNGIGNYLRAEILYRLSIPPFAEARGVLEPLIAAGDIKRETPDILDLCHQLPNEVIKLSGGKGYIHSPDDPDGHNTFWEWLQCYYKTGMTNMVDHNGRTIWFNGPAGNLVPKDKKSRGRKVHTKKRKNDDKEEEETEPDKKKSINTRGKVEKQKEAVVNGVNSRSSRRSARGKKEEQQNGIETTEEKAAVKTKRTAAKTEKTAKAEKTASKTEKKASETEKKAAKAEKTAVTSEKKGSQTKKATKKKPSLRQKLQKQLSKRK